MKLVNSILDITWNRHKVALETSLKELSEVGQENQRILAENEKLMSRTAAYFVALQKMEKQRDEWREMFYEQAAAHAVAQGILEKGIVRTRQAAGKLLVEVNKLRAKEGLSGIKLKDLSEDDGLPLGQVAKYVKMINDLCASLPVQLSSEKLSKEIEEKIDKTHG